MKLKDYKLTFNSFLCGDYSEDFQITMILRNQRDKVGAHNNAELVLIDHVRSFKNYALRKIERIRKRRWEEK